MKKILLIPALWIAAHIAVVAGPFTLLLLIPRWPKTIKISKIGLFLFILISYVYVYSEASWLHYFGYPTTPQTAVVTTNQTSGKSVRIGEVFAHPVIVNNLGATINAAQIELTFDPRLVRIVGISTKDSFIKMFILRSFVNDQGSVIIAGGLPNPGFTGRNALVATVYFEALSAGNIHIKYLPTSMVLANDGRGTNIIQKLDTVDYIISNEPITATEASQQIAKYTPEYFDFDVAAGQIGYTEHQATKPSEIHQVTTPQASNTFFELLARVDLFILNVWYTIFLSN